MYIEEVREIQTHVHSRREIETHTVRKQDRNKQ